MRLSIVTTLYHSAPYLREFYARASAAARRLTEDYEIILVNDDSPDDALDVALALYQTDERVRVIDLARNFGHHKALMTGLAQARGALVFLLDSDLEEPPELLGQFYQELENSGADVIYGVQQTRKGGRFERYLGQLFYELFNLLSSYPITPNQVAARLMGPRYVAALIEHRDREIFLAGLWAITGFKQIPVIVNKHSKGSSTYTFKRKVSLFINSITSFSNKPLIFIFYLGCSIVLCSSIAAGYLVVRRMFFGVLLSGWPSLIVSIWLLGGITIFCLGVIGIYLSKIFTETKQRPYTVIRQIYERTGAEEHELKQHQETVSQYYTEKVQTHGATARGVDWNSPESQTLRFEQLLKICESDRPFSINDYGCGYGALVGHLTDRKYTFQYHGFDLSPQMIAQAKTIYGEGPAHEFFTDEARLTEADYTIASGIFNVKLRVPIPEWEEYVLDTLRKIAMCSRRGFAVNLLTKYSDKERQRPDLYYADPLFWFDYCKANFSRYVALLHDYPLFEFTLLVRKS